MRQVYDLFAGTKTSEDVLAAASKSDDEKTESGQLFYAHLYLGFWYDVNGDHGRALEEMDASLAVRSANAKLMSTVRIHRDVLRAKDANK